MEKESRGKPPMQRSYGKRQLQKISNQRNKKKNERSL